MPEFFLGLLPGFMKTEWRTGRGPRFEMLITVTPNEHPCRTNLTRTRLLALYDAMRAETQRGCGGFYCSILSIKMYTNAMSASVSHQPCQPPVISPVFECAVHAHVAVLKSPSMPVNTIVWRLKPPCAHVVFLLLSLLAVAVFLLLSLLAAAVFAVITFMAA